MKANFRFTVRLNPSQHVLDTSPNQTFQVFDNVTKRVVSNHRLHRSAFSMARHYESEAREGLR